MSSLLQPPLHGEGHGHRNRQAGRRPQRRWAAGTNRGTSSMTASGAIPRHSAVGHQQNKTKLALVRALHTAIYLFMAAATCFVLYSGVTGYRGVWLTGALVLVTIEGVVFFGNGMKCPLTGLAQRYGAEKGYVFDTFLPERPAKHTFGSLGQSW